MNRKIWIPILALSAAGLNLSYFYRKGLLGFTHPMKTPKSGQIRVACVGDSITYGHGVRPWPKASYPAVLQAFLGEQYCVNNFGFSGRTAGEYGDYPYCSEKLFQKSLDFGPDIVIIMLGTNDTKPYNWRGSDAYRESLRSIVNAYQARPVKPRIILAAPPPAYSSMFDIRGEVLRDEMRAAVKELAEQEDIEFSDVFETLDGHPEMFSDGVHPDAEGAKVIAGALFHRIKEADR